MAKTKRMATAVADKIYFVTFQVIIIARKLTCKGFRANRFKGQGDPVEEKDKEKKGGLSFVG